MRRRFVFNDKNSHHCAAQFLCLNFFAGYICEKEDCNCRPYILQCQY